MKSILCTYFSVITVNVIVRKIKCVLVLNQYRICSLQNPALLVPSKYKTFKRKGTYIAVQVVFLFFFFFDNLQVKIEAFKL